MRFKQYLNEVALLECDMCQGDDGESSSTDLSQVNFRLADALDKDFLSPESGVAAIRKVLVDFQMELPALYGADPEGEEIVVDLDKTNLYVLYNLTDDNRYEFYAEVGDEERMEELMSDEEFDEEE